MSFSEESALPLFAPSRLVTRLARRSAAIASLAVVAACTSATSVTSASGPTQTSGLTARQSAFLDTLERDTFNWFWDLTDPNTGLTPDRWPTKSFSSIAAIGFGLTAYPVGVERGYVSRADAAQRTLNTLRFLYDAPQGSQATDVTGYKGFFYHFLDMQTGYRFEQVELSTIDTSLLLGGVLFCQSYFTGSDATENTIRAYADSIYLRVDWPWAVHNAPLVSMGWHPESGFIDSDWKGYDEGMIVYVLALGSPTHPIDPAAWTAWTQSYVWLNFYGQPFVNFPPLFGHQYSHLWIDFRGIQDAYMRGKGIDYFENSRRATNSQRSYAIENPGHWRDYGANFWGLTAVDGPHDTTVVVDGVTRQFHTYTARGAAADYVMDDGTLAPTAPGGSIAFSPEIAVPALIAMREKYGDNLFTKYGFVDSYNPTFQLPITPHHGHVVAGVGWFDNDYLGIDQGPIIAMIENYRSDLIWKTMRKNPYIVSGLKRAGFTGGWLGK
jgi:hypothetical protein